MNFFSILGGYNGDVYLLVKLLLPTAGKKRVYNLQSKQIVKLLSQVIHSPVPCTRNVNIGTAGKTFKLVNSYGVNCACMYLLSV